MDLKQRLRALEAASGRRTLPDSGTTAVSAAHAAPHLPAVRAAIPAASGRSQPAADLLATGAERALAQRLGAVHMAPGLLFREVELAAAHRHGGQVLGEVCSIGEQALGVALPPPASGWLFLDTETTGLAGGTGTLVFLFGAVQVDASGFRLRQWLLTRFGGEAAMLDAIRQAFGEVAMIVSFNGKSFDLPLLRTRMRLHARALEERHLVHLDLLHPARSAFGARWPDVRLQTAEQRLCDYRRDDDLPGSEAPLAFTRWLRHGEADGLVRVMQHHRDDVLSLVSLSVALAEAYRDPQRLGADEGGIVRRLNRRGYRVREGQRQLAFSP
ncbi:MAG: ribonuclease H-like domain-containing protein [Pseudomonadota bacterium]|nr:ribonuclease H-like domain-containing protein [Pseudomonadota bacterium]